MSRSPPEGPTRRQAGDDCRASEPEQGAADDRRHQTRRRHFGGSGARCRWSDSGEGRTCLVAIDRGSLD